MSYRVPSSAVVPGQQAYLIVTDPRFKAYEESARAQFPQLNGVFDGIRDAGLEWAQAARARRAVDQVGQMRASSAAMRLISALDAARRISCPLSTLQHAAKAGRLRGEKVGGRWLFDPADVDAYAAGRRVA